jgi:alpha,alpha-trehalase
VVALADNVRLNRYWDDRAAPRDESYREDLRLARGTARPADEVYRDVRAAAESGWDFSSRWLADAKTLSSIETTNIVPVDLNSLLFGLETAIALGCERVHDDACIDEFTRRSAARHAAIDRYLWQDDSGVFGDYDWRRRHPTDRLSAATLYPLFTGLAQPKQAQRVARVVEMRLLKPGGLATTAVASGQQWDLPNGWAPLQWIAVRGLRAYGETELARTIAERWLANVGKVYRASGKLVEKYDVVDLGRPGGGGEYPLQDGFAWTNGVTAQLMRLYPDARLCSTQASQVTTRTATLH